MWELLSPSSIANAVVLLLVGAANVVGLFTVQGRRRAKEVTRLRLENDEAILYAFQCRRTMNILGVIPPPLPPTLDALYRSMQAAKPEEEKNDNE